MKILFMLTFAIVVVMGGVLPVSLAQQEADFLLELDSIRNPFHSYLIKKKEIPPPPLPVVEKDPVFVQPRVDPPPPSPVVPPVFVNPVEVKDDMSFMQNLKLNGVIWDTDMPQAIISDKVMKVGDQMDGAQVTAIDKKGVEILHNGFKYLLSVSGTNSAVSQEKP